MNANQVNRSHTALFTSGGSLLALFGAAQVQADQADNQRQRGDADTPVCECWNCYEVRPDDLGPCPDCDAEAVAF